MHHTFLMAGVDPVFWPITLLFDRDLLSLFRATMKGPFLILSAFFFQQPMLRGVSVDMRGGLSPLWAAEKKC